MLVRFLNNWPYKLLALAIAVVLRVYVGDATNPQSTKQITVPINVVGVPSGLVATQATPNVSVTFSGPPSKIDTLTSSDIQATVNMSKAHQGSNAALPIAIAISPVLRDQVQSESTMPSGAAVYLDSKQSMTMSVTPEFSRSAPVGYEYQSPTVSPSLVRVDGPQSVLKSISRLAVFADPGDTLATPTTIDQTGPIVALDSRDAQIDGVDITPRQAHMIIPIRKVGALKSLVVSAQVIGSPRFPLRISEVDVDPIMVIVTGPAPVLTQTSVALTVPIDVSSESDTFRRTVKLDLPPGIVAIQYPNVDVTVHFTSNQPGAAQPGGMTSNVVRQGTLP